MKVKFTFTVKDDKFSYNKSTVRNVDVLTNENIERWAFENFKVTIKDYFYEDTAVTDCEKCLVSVKYNTADHAYEYGKDAESDTFYYYIDKNKVHYYTTTTLFDNTITYYIDCIECDNSENINCKAEKCDIELDKNVIYDIINDFAKNTFGVEFSKEDFNKANEMFNQVVNTYPNKNLDKEDEAEDTCCTIDNKESENMCQDNYDLRYDILYHLDQMKQKADDSVFHYIKLQIVDKIRQRNYQFAKISDDLKDYRAIDNVKVANGIIVNITGVNQADVTENVMEELIAFAKLEDMSNVLFDRVQDGTFNVIFKL